MDFILHGAIAYTPTFNTIICMQSGYIVYINDKIEGVYEVLPEKMHQLKIIDYDTNLIIPGMSDLHMHAPQYAFRGIGQNIENNEWNKWFERYAFPEESRYYDLNYAERSYTKLANDLLKTPTTRVCAFATIHREATELLMEILSHCGFGGYVGKVNMDRNSIKGLLETTEESVNETEKWLNRTLNKYSIIHPIITPRYIPSCTDALMEHLSTLIKEYKVPIQSHLSEGLDEICWVKSLKPEIESYSQGYEMYHMMGDIVPTVQAHCVYPTQQDIKNMTNCNLMVAHCPGGNMHSSGGIAPIMEYLKAGIRVGFGTDIAGGSTINLFRVLMEGIMASKVWWAEKERKNDPHIARNYLSLTNAFFIATKGGGSFFGLVGSFEPGYALDAVIIDERRFADENTRSVYERLERVLNLSDDRDIIAKFINGKQIL